MTEIKKESADGAWLRSTLAELAGDAFPVYDLPSLQVDTNSSIQLSALADRQAAREMRQAASDVEARRLDAARVVEGLKTEAERLRGLIADGKAALRAGEPVSPDAGVASFLLPDIEAEFSQPGVARFLRGTCGMARTQNPHSANSQFFIMFAPASSLDGQYTIWGQVTAGMEAIDKIKRGAGGSGMVQGPDKIRSLKVAADAA